MAYDKIPEYEAGAPKKADVLIRCTQNIALKQEELCEQTKLALARIDEAIEIFSKNNTDSAYVVKQSGEIFDQLQSENSALKQELLYLAKQSENIYAGLAEKITEISDQSKEHYDAFNGIADKLNDVAGRTVNDGAGYAEIADKLVELSEQNKRNESLISSLNEKLEAIYERTKLNEKAYGELSDKIVVSEKAAEPVEVDFSEVMNKLNFITEQLKRTEGAHSMLADKFEILSMRVEQFGFESAKNPMPYHQQPVAYPVPTQTVVPTPVQTIVKEEIDYDKLAEKVASLISTREAISPDYIASKVAEQIILPGTEAAKVNVSVDGDKIARQVAEMVSVDGDKIARQVADYINTNGAMAARSETAATSVAIDEEGLADRIAERLGGLKTEEVAPVAATVDIDEESLAERIAKKVGGMRAVAASSDVQTDIDEEELADRISLKVGSLKSEDFEILVDDNGCSSISKEIADHLDYNAISNIIADKLRDVLDLAAVNAPDYEEMAERISEKITVAGINEDAIADKAAAVLSNYLPEFDTDEITDKITGAVIDVVNAMPQPTIDSEAICNAISERLIESQEDHDYDIVIDDDGISKITALVAEEIEKGVATRFDSVDDNFAKITELVEDNAETGARFDRVEEEIAKISELVQDNDNADSRFDKVEEELARISELLTAKAEEEQEASEETEEQAEETAETEAAAEVAETVEKVVASGLAEEDYTKLSELVAEEIKKGTVARFDKVEEDIAVLTELVNSSITVGNEEYKEEYEYTEDDYAAISEVVAAEIEKGVTSRLSGIEENVAKLTEIITIEEEVEEEPEAEETEAEELSEEEYETEDAEEEDYTRLSEAVAAEVEKTLSARLNGMEENIAKITEIITAEEEVEEEELEAETEAEELSEEEYETEDAEEEDYTRLSEAVAAEVEKTLTARFESVEQNIARISELITAEEETEETEEHHESVAANTEAVEVQTAEVQPEEFAIEADYSAISEIVAAEIEKGVAARLDSVDEKVSAISSLVESANETNARFDRVEEELAKINEIVSDNTAVNERFDRLEEGISKATENISYSEQSGAVTETNEIFDRLEESIAKVNETLTESSAVNERFDRLEESIAKVNETLTENSAVNERFDRLEESISDIKATVHSGLTENGESATDVAVLAANTAEVNDRFDKLEESISKISELLTVEEGEYEEEYEDYEAVDDYSAISEVVAAEIEKGVAARFDSFDERIATITELVETANASNAKLVELVTEGAETKTESNIEESNERFARLEESIARISDNANNTRSADFDELFTRLEESIAKISENVKSNNISEANDRFDRLEESIAKVNDAVRMDRLADNVAIISDGAQSGAIAETNARFDKLENSIEKLAEAVANNNSQAKAGAEEQIKDERISNLAQELAEIKAMLAGGLVVASAAGETAAAQTVAVEEIGEDEELVTVSDIVPEAEEPEEEQVAEESVQVEEVVVAPVVEEVKQPEPEEEEFEEDEEEEDGENNDDFLLNVLDVDAFGDDELMPGELSDYAGGVDFANMMKFKRSFIARIIQSSDDYKQYYGEVKHALLSYRKVNSNVAWGAERFNKGRETIARLKIRGKTLCLYLALDPNEYKVSVYHHLDVSDNKSVAGTPMLVKVKSPLGVRKAIRLIDEMLAKRNGEKREIPERDYAAMYPYETIEELIEDGLVKDVRKK